MNMIKKVCFLWNAIRMASLVVTVMVSTAVRAQYQLPDPSFEDWSGAQFDGNIQPKYWNFSNVSQLGIANFNFAQRETGRNGGYAMKVQDQMLKVMGIGETSPGYIALGHPWAHVASISEIDKATAGTYGGIAWTTRPDSMAVWIKRTGSHWQDENYNILFYSWVGTSEAGSFKGKNGSCSTVPDTYIYDEESDIRLALDGNECSTVTAGTQIAEGWIYERKEYPNWTRIVIPIYYLNDLAPEKCNVIFSASNYPNFRAISGLYAGNTLIVDDVELIYSSAIQKLYIGGKEWKGFDPTKTGVQTYSLGQGVTTIPTIEARRGAGKLTNNKGTSAHFPGRKLSASECVINTTGAAVDGAPVTITVAAEDGSSTTTYQIQFVSRQSTNPYLSSIRVDGTLLAGFNAYVNNYNVSLPYGTTTVPVLTAEAQDGATITITQATSVNGTATIQTVAQDGVTKQTYTVKFSVAQLSDNTLKNILIDGNPLPGFVPSKGNYTVSLPLGTTTAPTVTWKSAYPAGAQTVQLVSNTLAGGCQITVSAPGAAMAKTYKLTYKIEASSYSYLSGIALDGEALVGFDAETFSYNITLPIGTTALPAITWTTGDSYQTVAKTEGGVEGTTRIVVTAAAGNTTTYRLNFSVLKSSNSRLGAIALNGETLDGFDSDILSYNITLPAGTKTLPTITWTTGDEYQSVRMIASGLNNLVRLIVTAGDGSAMTYVLNFSVEKSASALLQMIYLNGEPLEGFAAETFDYTYRLAEDEQAPRITVTKGDGQTVSISQPQAAGTARITVLPEEGEGNVYTIKFLGTNEVVIPDPVFPTYVKSNNADLEMIYVNEVALAGFAANVTEYSYNLPLGTTEQPVLTADVADDKAALLIITQGEVNADATIRVVAEDSLTYKDYTIHFPVAKSSNTAPDDIDAGGYISYDAAQHEYNFELPFGTPFPEIFVTKAEESQTVAMEYLTCKTRRDVEIKVTAEDGSRATYSIHMIIPSHPNNVLKGIMGEGFAIDSVSLNSRDTVLITLPVGTDTFAINTIVKNYDDQYVVVRDGGLKRETEIWVYSGRAGEEAKRYTLMPKVQNPYLLTDLKVNGTTIDGFAPERSDYIISIEEDIPTITATAVDGATVEEVISDTKHYQVSVDYSGVLHTYTVWYYYVGDVIPNANFAESATAKYNNAFKPKYWQVPADGDDSYSWLLQGTVKTGTEVTPNSDGSIRLATWRSKASNSIYGSLPGMMTLGTLSLEMTSAGKSKSSVSGGIDFRNTPDTLLVDARPISNKVFTGLGAKNMPNWRVLTMLDEQENLYEGSFSVLNTWQTVRLALLHDELVSCLNIVLNSGNSENAQDYGGDACYTSQVDFRNVRVAYSSNLKGITYNGATIAPDASKHFEIALPTEFFGVPTLGFVHGVADQATEIAWSNEVAGVRTATIRNYAEDGSYTDYTLTATRSLSTDAGFTLIPAAAPVAARRAAMDASPLANLHFRTNSVHAKAAVEIIADSVYIVVTPEAGEAVRAAYSAFKHDTIRSLDAGEIFIGQDSTMVDTIHTVLNGNLNLAAIQLDGNNLESYAPYELNYELYTASTQTVVGVPGDEQQTVTVETQTLSDGTDLTYIYVRAGNGDKRIYSLRQTHTLPSTDATLAAIEYDLNGVATSVPSFASTTYTYTVELAPHSTLPDVNARPTDNNAIVSMSRAGNELTFLVTAEDGVTTQTYRVAFTIAPSDYSTLTDIMLNGSPLEGFDPAQTTYDVVLPVGTTVLPTIEYTKLESAETVAVDTTALSNYTGRYTLTVTAEDGVHRTVYTINFTVAKSTNANLSSLSVDGTPVAGFDAEQLTYAVTLPYGYMCVPEVRYETEDTTATAVLNAPDQSVATVTVTAEDGTTTKTYTINYTIAKSGNAELDMIFLNGDSLEGYDKENLEYNCTYAYGASMPKVTYTIGDEQQTVEATTTDNVVTLKVTAGDGETVNEYVLIFVQELSDNNYLSDLQLSGKTVAGFHRDSMEYLIEYPVGTAESELLTKDDVLATPEDADALVVVNEDASHTLTVIVTAPNGDVRAYVVRQEILLSGEARLKMIYLNEVELADFDPDVTEYEFIIPIGATAPEATAEAMDEHAEVEYGMLTDEEGGSFIEIDGVAEDGTTITYIVHFVGANWSPSPDVNVDEYRFLSIGGGQYKAVTIGLNVQIAIYDMMGHLLEMGKVPTVDVNDVVVEVDADGKKRIVEVLPSADGYIFTAAPGQPYFYVFFDTRTKRIAKGNKFMTVR